ncbi:hypothetical protein ECC11_06375 [Helicobacter pylori]|nr:hypothetical protein ECC11_06375 [Helicobacter pylori]
MNWWDFCANGGFVVSKKKKGFWGVLEPFLIVKKVLKFGLIKIAVKWGVGYLVGSFWIWLQDS